MKDLPDLNYLHVQNYNIFFRCDTAHCYAYKRLNIVLYKIKSLFTVI